MNTNEIRGVSSIVTLFNVFIFDIWGTIYDGHELFPETAIVLEKLKNHGKQIIFLSNSPQLPSIVAQRLAFLGITKPHYDFIVTSGGETNQQLIKRDWKEISAFKGSVFETGPNRFPDTLPKDEFPIAPSIYKANWILNAGPDSPSDKLTDYKHLLEIAAKRNLPMLCANPDKIVFHGSEKHLCAGGIAEYYESLGGYNLSIGKPYPAVFERCINMAIDIQKKETVMIGDNLETDILGANNIGLQSLFIASGVHKLTNKSENNIYHDRLRALQKKIGASPTYVIPNLRW
jgi:HAD superfamily hydrolase (TIGR01459 family)